MGAGALMRAEPESICAECRRISISCSEAPLDLSRHMFKIFTYLGKHTVGEFAADALWACTVRELFDEAELYVYYVNNRPHKKDLVSCIWNANSILEAPPSGNEHLPIELFDTQSRNTVFNNVALERSGALDADIILTGKVFSDAGLNSFDLPALRVPDSRIDASDQALLDLGLDPTKWIATVYWKSPGYAFRGANHVRDIADPGPYLAAIRHIVENLGGQVVRIGHPTDLVLPDLPGVVDLSKNENSHWLQLYAITVSRFLLASMSGPASYGSAFGVPAVVCDAMHVSGVWRSQDYLLTRTFVRAGKTYNQREAFNAGFLGDEKYKAWHRNSVRDEHYLPNSSEQLIAAADEMFHSTSACIGWRAPWTGAVPSARANTLALPREQRLRLEALIPPSQRANAT